MPVIDFFQSLSSKYHKENDLSDITWAMCLSCESFRVAFLKFFFPEMIIKPSLTIEREKAEDDSRPDFYIENGDDRYLIENKINDTNHHFGQYDETFNIKPVHFGYITNYVIYDNDVRNKGYRLHTWEELYKSFLNNLPNNVEEQQLWKGYLEFVKNVCGIIKIEKPMNLEGLYSLYSLVEILDKPLSNRSETEFSLSIYDKLKKCGGGYASGVTGVNFELNYKSLTQNKIWGWIGIFYYCERPTIAIGFPDTPSWGKGFIDLIRPFKNNWSDQSFFKKPYFDEGCLWFELLETHFEEFNKLQNIDDQITLLKNYMDEVILYPKVLFE
ncbi:MAG: hypothetical protein IKM74_07610 [Bacteroidales bacterium]|nr:hypothetical protein [Bacteroidales bacterium]